jgi:hypothetical protein
MVWEVRTGKRRVLPPIGFNCAILQCWPMLYQDIVWNKYYCLQILKRDKKLVSQGFKQSNYYVL